VSEAGQGAGGGGCFPDPCDLGSDQHCGSSSDQHCGSSSDQHCGSSSDQHCGSSSSDQHCGITTGAATQSAQVVHKASLGV
jgi:hypothetical protein